MNILVRFIPIFIKILKIYGQCNCPNTIPNPPQNLANININFSTTQEVINGTNYGYPFALLNYTFLSKDLNVDKSISSINTNCPTGYRVPTIGEFQNIISTIG